MISIDSETIKSIVRYYLGDSVIWASDPEGGNLAIPSAIFEYSNYTTNAAYRVTATSFSITHSKSGVTISSENARTLDANAKKACRLMSVLCKTENLDDE